MNSLDINLTGKTVLIKKEVLGAEFHADRRFKVRGGFGASAATIGTALLGTWLADGENDRVSSMDVEALADEG